MSPARARPHLRTASRLHRLLLRAVSEHLIVGRNGGLVDGTGRETYLIPDLVVIPDAVLDIAGPALSPRETLLAVEALSPGSGPIDMVTKRDHYARMGVPRYWIGDPDARSLTVMLLDDERRSYDDTAVVTAGEAWRTDDPFPITLNPADFR